MSYRLKGATIKIEGNIVTLKEATLPVSPTLNQLIIDSTDHKYKVWNGSRWIILGDAADMMFDNSINGFVSTKVQPAIEEAKQMAEGFPRAGIRSTYNSTLPNNQWIGPNELLPNTPLLVLPIKTKLNEITWSNPNTNRAFTIKFYKNGKLAGNLFYTLTVTSPNSGSGYVSELNFTFDPGDVIYAYSTTTAAPSDMDLVLWISRVP